MFAKYLLDLCGLNLCGLDLCGLGKGLATDWGKGLALRVHSVVTACVVLDGRAAAFNGAQVAGCWCPPRRESGGAVPLLLSFRLFT